MTGLCLMRNAAFQAGVSRGVHAQQLVSKQRLKTCLITSKTCLSQNSTHQPTIKQLEA
jgi:hypothetical protein